MTIDGYTNEDAAIYSVAKSERYERRDYCWEETLGFAKWARQHEEILQPRYFELAPDTRKEFDLYDYLQIMWERQRHIEDCIY